MGEVGVRLVQIDHLQNPDWRVAGCSLVGPSHNKLGKGCDDAFSWTTRDRWLVASVADGAGSAKRGGEGAVLATTAVCEILKETLPIEFPSTCIRSELETTIRQSISGALSIISETASGSDSFLSDFHTTLVGVVALGRRGVIFHIGDGSAVAMQIHDEYSTTWCSVGISTPANGEYVNETFFITLSNWENHLRFEWIEDFDSVIMMTDGVTPFALNRMQNSIHLPFLEPLLNVLCDITPETAALVLRNMLAREDIRQGCDDDKTIVWLAPDEPSSRVRQETPTATTKDASEISLKGSDLNEVKCDLYYDSPLVLPIYTGVRRTKRILDIKGLWEIVGIWWRYATRRRDHK